MLIDFNKIQAIKFNGLNNGKGEMTSKMYADDIGKIISC